MDVFSPFQQVPASQLQPGSIVVLNWNRVQKTVALVVNAFNAPCFVLLNPGHPDLGQPGILMLSMSDAPVYVVPGAIAVIDADPAGIAYKQHGDYAPAGALFLDDSGDFAIKAYQDARDMMAFSIKTGEIVTAQWQVAWFPKWRIVTRTIGDEHQTVCTIEAKVPTVSP